MTTPRKHAELAARYMADDTLKCWLKGKIGNTTWAFTSNPDWDSNWEYHVGHEPPTETMMVFGHELPKPISNIPKIGIKYWIASNEGTSAITWDDDNFGGVLFSVGNCFKTESDAQAWVDFQRDLRLGKIGGQK